MRIIGGRYRGRALAAPSGHAVRPTADRVREAIFNVLVHAGWGVGGAGVVSGAQVLDAFAGSGALGIEALSRGAAEVHFLDRDRDSIRTLRRNLQALDVDDVTEIIDGDALNPPRATVAATLVLMDPPYESGLAAPALEALDRRGWIAPGAIIVVECARKETFEPPAQFSVLDTRNYGAARIVFLRRK